MNFLLNNHTFFGVLLILSFLLILFFFYKFGMIKKNELLFILQKIVPIFLCFLFNSSFTYLSSMPIDAIENDTNTNSLALPALNQVDIDQIISTVNVRHLVILGDLMRVELELPVITLPPNLPEIFDLQQMPSVEEHRTQDHEFTFYESPAIINMVEAPQVRSIMQNINWLYSLEERQHRLELTALMDEYTLRINSEYQYLYEKEFSPFLSQKIICNSMSIKLILRYFYSVTRITYLNFGNTRFINQDLNSLLHEELNSRLFFKNYLKQNSDQLLNRNLQSLPILVEQAISNFENKHIPHINFFVIMKSLDNSLHSSYNYRSYSFFEKSIILKKLMEHFKNQD